MKRVLFDPSRRGFTLVELLVVIAIIGILVALFNDGVGKMCSSKCAYKLGTYLFFPGSLFSAAPVGMMVNDQVTTNQN